MDNHSRRTGNRQSHSAPGQDKDPITNSDVTSEGERFLAEITDALEAAEAERDERIRGLIKKVETFTREFPTQNRGPLSEQLVCKAYDLLSHLRLKVQPSSWSQDEKVYERHGRTGPGRDDSSKTPGGSASVDMTSEYDQRRSVLLPMEVTNMNRLATDVPSLATDVPSLATDVSSLAKEVSRSLGLLLLGSSGNGKSSTGNSILGKNVFMVSSSMSTSTTNIAMGSTHMGDLAINVVDGPSIHDSQETDQDFLERIINAMESSLDLCDYTFSAIIIVLKFGTRFTKQEADTIKLIKSVLGKNVIQDYGICVITYGDNFQHAVEEAAEDGEALTFESWCREQSGEVRTLFQECKFRCVLFDNRTKDLNTKNAQRKALLNLVDPKIRYSKEQFLHAEQGLKEVLATETLIPNLEQQTQHLIDDTKCDLQRAADDDPLQYDDRMDSLLQQLKDHQEMLEELGLRSPKLSQLLLSIKVLEMEIHSKRTKRRLMKNNKRPVRQMPSSDFLPSIYPQTKKFQYDPYSHGCTNFQESESEVWYHTTVSSNDPGIQPFESDRPRSDESHSVKNSVYNFTKRKWKAIRKLLGLK